MTAMILETVNNIHGQLCDIPYSKSCGIYCKYSNINKMWVLNHNIHNT